MQIDPGTGLFIGQIGEQVIAVKGVLYAIATHRDPISYPINGYMANTASPYIDVELELKRCEIVVMHGTVEDMWGHASKNSTPYVQPALEPQRKELDG